MVLLKEDQFMHTNTDKWKQTDLLGYNLTTLNLLVMHPAVGADDCVNLTTLPS